MTRRTKVIIIIISLTIFIGILIFAGIRNISKNTTEEYSTHYGVNQDGREVATESEEEKKQRIETKRSKIQDKTKAYYRQLETSDKYNIPYNGIILEDTENLGDSILDFLKNKEGTYSFCNGISSVEVRESELYSEWYECTFTMMNNFTYHVYIQKDHSNGWIMQRNAPGTDLFGPLTGTEQG